MSKTSDVYKLFIGFVLFICITVGLLIYANNQNYVRVDYNNINEFLQNKNNISFYEMYDAYAYIIEGKKELISQSDMTFSHQYTHTDKYHIEDNENETLLCSYNIIYAMLPMTFADTDILLHNFTHGEVIIGKERDTHNILINYTSNKLSYFINLNTSIIGDYDLINYEQKILDYIEDTYSLHH